MKGQNHLHTKLIIVAFVEGAAVMACELLGAKMIAPFFGTTLYSWAGVLAITLGALAIGYYTGGIVASRFQPVKALSWVILVSGLLLLFMPLIGKGILSACLFMPLRTGLLLSLLVFLLPPVLCFGMVSPLIIQSLVKSVDASGKTAGRIYAISTLGGVINTLFIGFYLLPELGIKLTALIYGLLLLLSLLLILPKKRLATAMVALVIFIPISLKLQLGSSEKEKGFFHLLYKSEGLMGQVKVMDYHVKLDNPDSVDIIPVRGLLVNNTWQTVVNSENGVGLLDYIYFIRPLLSPFAHQNKTALLVGLGGGTLAREIISRNISLDIVEIDSRLEKVTRRYFGLPDQAQLNIDDGRHFLQNCQKKYDLIILDAFLGENPPWHLLTLENFKKINSLLYENGALLIEFYGYMDGKPGISGRSVYKTLKEAGFNTQIVATGKTDGIERNFIYVASRKPFSFDSLDYSGIKYTDKNIINLKDWLLDTSKIDLQQAVILTDDVPALETMLMNPALDWRRMLNKHFRNQLIEQGYEIFY